MRKIMLALALLAASPALAQTPEIAFKLTPQEIEVVGQGLAELPLKVAAPILNKLREQYVAQQPKEVPKADDPQK